MNKARLDGDILYYLTGDDSQLTDDSIITRLRNKGKVIEPGYSEAMADAKKRPSSIVNFAEWCRERGYYKPCISILIIHPEYAEVRFSRVCTENFAYDIHIVRAMIEHLGYDPDMRLHFSGMIKDFTE